MLALFDSTITFQAQYQQRRDMPALLDLLVLDRDNPRSLGWVVQTLRGRIAKLAASTPDDLTDLAVDLPEPGSWSIASLCEKRPDVPEAERYRLLIKHLEQCNSAAFEMSDLISRRYFSHATPDNHSLVG